MAWHEVPLSQCCAAAAPASRGGMNALRNLAVAVAAHDGVQLALVIARAAGEGSPSRHARRGKPCTRHKLCQLCEAGRALFNH